MLAFHWLDSVRMDDYYTGQLGTCELRTKWLYSNCDMIWCCTCTLRYIHCWRLPQVWTEGAFFGIFNPPVTCVYVTLSLLFESINKIVQEPYHLPSLLGNIHIIKHCVEYKWQGMMQCRATTYVKYAHSWIKTIRVLIQNNRNQIFCLHKKKGLQCVRWNFEFRNDNNNTKQKH